MIKKLLLFSLSILYAAHIFAQSGGHACLSENSDKVFRQFLLTANNAGSSFTEVLAETTPLAMSECASDQVLYNVILANASSKVADRINPVSTKHYQLSIQKSKEAGNESLLIFSKLEFAYYLYHFRSYQELMPELIEVINHIEDTDQDKILLPDQTYKKIGWILQTLGKHDQSIKFLQLAQKSVSPQSSEAAGLLDNIGTAYLYKGDLVNAQHYFERSIVLSQKIKDYIRMAKAMGNLAQVYEKKGDTAKAIQLLTRDVGISEEYGDEQNTMFASIILGELFVKTRNLDSAGYYIGKAEKIAEPKTYFQSSLLQALKIKLKIAMQQQDSAAELDIRRRISELEKTLKNADGPEGLQQAQWKLQENDLAAKIQKAQTKSTQDLYIKVILFLFGGSMIVFALFLIIQSRAGKIRKQKEFDQAAELHRIEKEAQEKHLHEVQASLQNQIEFLKSKTSHINSLQKELEILRSGTGSNTEEQHENLQKILETHLMTEENWLSFRNEFRKVHGEFYNNIVENFPEITDSNLRIILLSKLGFNNTEMSGLLGVTPDAVKKSKQRLKKKLGDRHEILDSYLQTSGT